MADPIAPPPPATSADLRQVWGTLCDAILAISAEHELETVLHAILDHARALTGARYAALGVPDASGERLERFVTSGLTAAEVVAIGAPPHGHGILGVVMREGRTLALGDLGGDARAAGFPAHHPPMHSFLGVPVRLNQSIVGHLYLTDKHGGAAFTAADAQVVELFARHAAQAIANARLMQRIETSEHRYRRLTDDTPAIILALDADGRVTFASARARSITGAAPEDWLGRPLRALVVPEDAPVVDAGMGALRTGTGRCTFAVRVPHADGGLRSLDVSLAADDGGTGTFHGIAVDVTDRHALVRTVAERTRERDTSREEQQRLHHLVGLIIQAQEDERARIAAGLHDTTVQTLTAIGRRLRSLAEASAPPNGLSDDLAQLATAALAEADEVRRLSRNLRPSVLDHLGLAAGLQHLAGELRHAGIEATVAIEGDDAGLDDDTRITLFRVAQEALTNIRLHSGARHATVSLRIAARETVLVVADDGRGFDPDAAQRAGRLGLAGMRERAALLGGTLEVGNLAGGGSQVTAWLPRGR